MARQEDIQYIFLDIVGYSNERTVEAQTIIIDSLNKFVREALLEFRISARKVIFLPTGDGICICLVNIQKPFDLPLLLSISILQKLSVWNSTASSKMNKYELRFGINENIDNIVIDINGKNNASGPGINMAQRIMNCADGNQILLGFSSYDKICDREKYYGKFQEYETKVKHGKVLKIYQYIESSYDFLNTNVPEKFAPPERVNLRPTRFIGAYSYLIVKYRKEIEDALHVWRIDVHQLYIALIYASLRIQEKLESDDFSRGILYSNFDVYLSREGLQLDKWVNDISQLDIMYQLDFSRFLVNEYLSKYDFYFERGSHYLALSEEGAEYQKLHFEEGKIQEAAFLEV